MKKSIIRVTAFLLILGIVLWRVNYILSFKYDDGIYCMTKYYEQEEDTVDVLVLGSSHAFESVNTGSLWSEYGIASYIIAGGVQPIWNSYYNLKEALKTQTPELIVLENFMVIFKEEYISEETVIKNTYGMKWSPDKYEALKVGARDGELLDYTLEYTQYHTRYTDLTEQDFAKNKNNYAYYENWKGFIINMETLAQEYIDVSGVTERAELNEKAEKYYRMTIELAQENSIPILIITAPYAEITEAQEKRYNTSGDIAAEYGVPYINFNLCIDDIGLNYVEDMADPSHLNYRGTLKFTHYLGEKIKENFEISDRRGDDRFSSWDRNQAAITQMIEARVALEEEAAAQMNATE
jgi:hypothetical protein